MSQKRGESDKFAMAVLSAIGKKQTQLSTKVGAAARSFGGESRKDRISKLEKEFDRDVDALMNGLCSGQINASEARKQNRELGKKLTALKDLYKKGRS